MNAVREILGKVWPYVLGGIAVGAAIHGYVPEGYWPHSWVRERGGASPSAVIIGVPIYSNAAGVIPIVQALMEKEPH